MYIQKYNLKDRGARLEKSDPLKAIEYYNNLKNHEFFVNDYYPYRRLVLMYEKTGDNENKVKTIREFFKSGIYCNEYNYQWFIYKAETELKIGEISALEEIFRKNSLKNRNIANTPLPIADRIRKKGKITVESVRDYNERQKIYEYELRLIRLYNAKKFREYIDLLNNMIDEKGLRKAEYLKKLSKAYRKIRDRENEIKTLERYFSGEFRHSRKNDLWFESRLDELNENEIKFDLNDFDLSRNPFFEYDRKLNDEENLKRKAIMIEYGKSLDTDDAISYYKYLCNNTYFKNDWYPYRKLSDIYEETGDYNAHLVNIKKLLQSGIYLNEYQFLYFSDKLRQLTEKCDIDSNTIRKWLDDYEIHGSVNRFKLNKYLSDRFIKKDSKIIVLNEDDFNYAQERLALRQRGLIYENVGNFNLAVAHYVKIISENEFNYSEFHIRLCMCLEKIHDCRRLEKAVELYYMKPPSDRDRFSDEWMENIVKKK